jgi:formylglycine-generating enzyme required for sulfatase activity
MTTLFPSLLTTPPRTETVNGHAFRMLALPAGRFEMGNNDNEEESYSDERPRHWVDVPAFELAEFPVTQALWDAVYVALPPARRTTLALPENPSYFHGATRPVEQVDWHQATAFCRALSELTGRTYRLPTEAEWEYAARCGRRGTLYAGSNKLYEVGWYGENNGTETMPVGLLTPNDWGLYDMSGNVDEWCADHWHGNYDGTPADGSAWLTEDESADRVFRGGSWYFSAWDCRAACRSRLDPGVRYYLLGFRLAASSVQEVS